MSHLHVKPKQPKLLPGRKPIIQIAEMPIHSKTGLKVSVPESSGHHDQVIPVSYTIPQTMSEHDSISRIIRRKDMQDFKREIPAYANPVYRLPPKLTAISTQVTQKTIPESNIDTLEHKINTNFEENSHIKKVGRQKHTEGQINHVSRKQKAR